MNETRQDGAALTRIARAGLGVTLLGMALIGAWLVWAPLSGAVIAPGFVKVDMKR
jgi:hypothetical protein